MQRGTRTKLISILTGALLLVGMLGAGSAFAATNTAPHMAARHDMKGSKGRQQHHGFLVIGKIVRTDGDTFTLATRNGEVKVHVDDNTKYRNGSRSDLDRDKVVAVAGKRKGRDTIDATLVAFIKHMQHGKR